MNILTICGRTYSVEGNKIVVKNSPKKHPELGNYVKVNDVIIERNIVEKDITVTFQGDLASLDCTKAIVHGNVQGDVDCTSLNCGDIGGDVDCTTLNCGNISGSVDATTVNCKKITM
jgi:hypothetical protein